MAQQLSENEVESLLQWIDAVGFAVESLIGATQADMPNHGPKLVAWLDADFILMMGNYVRFVDDTKDATSPAAQAVISNALRIHQSVDHLKKIQQELRNALTDQLVELINAPPTKRNKDILNYISTPLPEPTGIEAAVQQREKQVMDIIRNLGTGFQATSMEQSQDLFKQMKRCKDDGTFDKYAVMDHVRTHLTNWIDFIVRHVNALVEFKSDPIAARILKTNESDVKLAIARLNFFLKTIQGLLKLGIRPYKATANISNIRGLGKLDTLDDLKKIA